MSKSVLVIGATGTMGSYLVPELVKLGYAVTAVSLDMQKNDVEAHIIEELEKHPV